MAKINNIKKTIEVMNSAAMNEAVQKEEVTEIKVTQKEGNKPIHLKKFPKDWHDRLKADHVNNITEYILNAVREKMKRDGLL